MIDTKLKVSGYIKYGKIYRLVSNRRMSTFTMVRWYVLFVNMLRYDILHSVDIFHLWISLLGNILDSKVNKRLNSILF